MTAPQDPGASARRMATWTAFLVLPLVLGALVVPPLVRRLRGGAAVVGAPTEADAPAAAPRPAPPTPDQIEAARRAQEDLARAQAGWQRAQTIAPREPARDASGDLVSPFEGFGVNVETAPPDALVAVNGRALGQAPLLASVPCRPGEALELTLTLPGHQVHRQVLRCRADTLQHLSVALSRRGP